MHSEPDLLRSAYRNSLDLAATHGAETIAFPSIILFSPGDLAVYQRSIREVF